MKLKKMEIRKCHLAKTLENYFFCPFVTLETEQKLLLSIEKNFKIMK